MAWLRGASLAREMSLSAAEAQSLSKTSQQTSRLRQLSRTFHVNITPSSSSSSTSSPSVNVVPVSLASTVLAAAAAAAVVVVVVVVNVVVIVVVVVAVAVVVIIIIIIIFYTPGSKGSRGLKTKVKNVAYNNRTFVERRSAVASEALAEQVS